MQSDTTYLFEYPPLHPFTAGASAAAPSREPSKTTSPSRGTRRGSIDVASEEDRKAGKVTGDTTLRRGQKRLAPASSVRSPSPRAAPVLRTRKDDGDNVVSPRTRASSVSSTEKDGAVAKRPRRTAAEVAARKTSLQVKMLDQVPEAEEEKEEHSADSKKRKKEGKQSRDVEDELSSRWSPSPPASPGPGSHQDTSLSKLRQPLLATEESSSTLELQDSNFLTPVSELLLLPEEQTHTPPQQTWAVGEAVEAKVRCARQFYTSLSVALALCVNILSLHLRVDPHRATLRMQCGDPRLPEYNAWFDSTVTADLVREWFITGWFISCAPCLCIDASHLRRCQHYSCYAYCLVIFVFSL
jgi:hypothetical protein